MTIVFGKKKSGGKYDAIDASDFYDEYQAVTDNAADTIDDIYQAGITQNIWPGYLAQDPTYPNLRRRGVEITQRTQNLFQWDIKVNWSSAPINSSEEDKRDNPNPVDRRPRFWLEDRTEQVPAVKDKDGKPILNSARDPYDPPIPKDSRLFTLLGRINVLDLPDWLFEWGTVVNSAAVKIYFSPTKFRTCAARTLKFISCPIPEEKKEDNYTFFELRPRFEYNHATWDAKPLDMGLRILNGSDEQEDILIPDTDGINRRPTAPVHLNGSGAQLNPVTVDTVVTRTHKIYEEKDFTVIPGIVSA